MIVDKSANVAILRGEPDAERNSLALSQEPSPRISAGTYLKTALVLDANHDPVLSGRLDDLLAVAQVKVEPVTKTHAEIARQAFRDFGKGSGPAAGLNLGDCFAYALARDSKEPLLLKGADFIETDVKSAPDDGAHGG